MIVIFWVANSRKNLVRLAIYMAYGDYFAKSKFKNTSSVFPRQISIVTIAKF